MLKKKFQEECLNFCNNQRAQSNLSGKIQKQSSAIQLQSLLNNQNSEDIEKDNKYRIYTEVVNLNNNEKKQDEISRYYDDENIQSELKGKDINHSLNGTVKVNQTQGSIDNQSSQTGYTTQIRRGNQCIVRHANKGVNDIQDLLSKNMSLIKAGEERSKSSYDKHQKKHSENQKINELENTILQLKQYLELKSNQIIQLQQKQEDNQLHFKKYIGQLEKKLQQKEQELKNQTHLEDVIFELKLQLSNLTSENLELKTELMSIKDNIQKQNTQRQINISEINSSISSNQVFQRDLKIKRNDPLKISLNQEQYQNSTDTEFPQSKRKNFLQDCEQNFLIDSDLKSFQKQGPQFEIYSNEENEEVQKTSISILKGTNITKNATNSINKRNPNLSSLEKIKIMVQQSNEKKDENRSKTGLKSRDSKDFGIKVKENMNSHIENDNEQHNRSNIINIKSKLQELQQNKAALENRMKDFEEKLKSRKDISK